MKKLATVLATLLLSAVLFSCTGRDVPIAYTDDTPITIAMQGDSLKILQLTDIHLTWGIDANDRLTLGLIRTLVEADDYDLVVLTGDLSMSTTGPALFTRIVNLMEDLETPWTFVFGNHETDHATYGEYLSRIEDTTWLRFEVGPALEDGGVGNFVITFTRDDVPFYNLYLFDSHAEREVYTADEGEYDYLRTSQVAWYEDHVAADTVPSIAFMHIPLRQFADPVGYEGVYDEKACPQGVDTGLFAAMVAAGRTVGVFVGHDHLNDYSLTLEGILLAYGRITGYNAYGDLERGGRVIAIDASGAMTTHVVLAREVGA